MTYFNGTPLDPDKLLEKVVSYRKNDSVHPLLNKFTIQYIISIIERYKITEIERSFKAYDKKGVLLLLLLLLL